MADLPSAGAKLELDLSEWESNWSSVMGDAADLQSTLDDLSGSVDVDVNLEIPDTGAIDDIEALDGEQISPEIDAEETKESKEIRDGINFLATMKAIEIAINVVGTALDFIKAVGSMVVTPFLDVEDAVAKINAQTGSGTGLADVGQFIRDIQAADLGENVDQISEMVIHASQLGAPIEEATTASLTFVKVFDTENPVTVMDTLKAASDEFEISISSAGDALTVFFQNGGNKGLDALTAVDKYSTSWKDMNLTFTEGLSLLHSLQEGGVDSADEAGKMIQTFDDAFTTAAADPNSQQAQFLAAHGLDNPKEMGEAIGAETIDGFVSAFTTLPADQQDLASQLFFGKGGKLNTSAITNATTQDSIFKDYIGAAKDAATEIDNSLRGAIDDFILEMNTKVSELLSSDSIDIPGKIKALKEGLQQGLAVLASGGTLGEALEVGLNIPGLSDTLDTFIGNFERIIGNIEIAFLQIVASIQDITGNGKAAEATRATIANKSVGQFMFDLQLANPDEVTALIDTAVSRGVTFDQLDTAVPAALNESIANMNFDQGGKILEGLIQRAATAGDAGAWDGVAADYVGKLDGAFDNAMSAGNLPALQDLIAIEPNAKIPGLDEAVAGFQKQLSDAFAPQNRAGDQGNPFLSGIGAGAGKGGAISGTGGMFGAIVTDVENFKTKAAEASDAAGVSFGNVGTSADLMATSLGTATNTANTNMVEMAMQAQVTDADVTAAMTGNTITASFEAVATAAASSFPGVISWFERTTAAAVTFDTQVSGHIQHLINLLHDLQFLSAQVATGVQQAIALGNSLPGAGGNVTTNNVTVNNTVPNGAAAAANGYAVAASLRPGGV